jgi:hypothetical protein
MYSFIDGDFTLSASKANLSRGTIECGCGFATAANSQSAVSKLVVLGSQLSRVAVGREERSDQFYGNQSFRSDSGQWGYYPEVMSAVAIIRHQLINFV